MVCELMGEKYEVPLKNESGDVIGVAKIDPDTFPGGVVEVQVTDENVKEALWQTQMHDFSLFIPPEKRFSGDLVKPAQTVIINRENKEKNDG